MKYSPIAAALSLVFGLVASGAAFADGKDHPKGGKHAQPEVEVEKSFNDWSEDDNDKFDSDQSFNDESKDDNDVADLDDVLNDKSQDDNDFADLDGSLNDQSKDDNDYVDLDDTLNDKSMDDNDIVDLDGSFNDQSHDTNFKNDYSTHYNADYATVEGKGVAATDGYVDVSDGFNEASVGTYGAAAGEDVDMDNSFNNASVAGFGASAGDDVYVKDSFNLESSENTVNAGDDAAVINSASGNGNGHDKVHSQDKVHDNGYENGHDHDHDHDNDSGSFLEAYFGDSKMQNNDLGGEVSHVSFQYSSEADMPAVSQDIDLGENVLSEAGGAINNNQNSGNANVASQGINISAGGFSHY